MDKKRVLSGMQPSGRLHLGNLIGALSNWVKLQESYNCFYFVADWHALTTGYNNPSAIKDSTIDLLVNFISAGLDPEKSTIFIQSMVPNHAELHILLSMITPVGWLERVPTYKEKIQEIQDKDINSYGFLGYPVLQTADIIIYRAHYVPVGVDQVPHLEISREISRRFNHLYKEVFPEPEALLTEFPKVLGVDGRKMSKSYDNAIYLSDSPVIVDNKIKTMMTDPARVKRKDPGNPEVCPAYQLHKFFSNSQELSEISEGCKIALIGCIDCKKILIKNVSDRLTPLWEKRSQLLQKEGLLMDIARVGSEKAQKFTAETMNLVKDAMGLSL
ncbi:MAG TPA: tryptophan--tRNA ligase [Nitrospirae bacterium]|nr:tryptophan--tRNA ligase [Nitrospirota bacterium]